MRAIHRRDFVKIGSACAAALLLPARALAGRLPARGPTCAPSEPAALPIEPRIGPGPNHLREATWLEPPRYGGVQLYRGSGERVYLRVNPDWRDPRSAHYMGEYPRFYACIAPEQWDEAQVQRDGDFLFDELCRARLHERFADGSERAHAVPLSTEGGDHQVLVHYGVMGADA